MTTTPPVPATNATLPRASGGFQLLKELGRGGMGVVYHAQEISSGRHVALKVLAAELIVSGEAFERFRREARLAAAISDSHCVFVYGAHEIEGAPAIAMELCGGETLEHRLARKEPIPIATAVRWALEILEGLEAAHRAGVVHRDVKPSNCFIGEDGHVKVGDFGLSRSIDRDVRLTQSGAFLGSPLYASPEQIKGREVDLRSDLYSCGATLYALLTGKSPYVGKNVGEVLARILSEPPPAPRSLRPEVPRALEKVVLRAMEREPDKRFRDHASFRAALEPFAASSGRSAGLGHRFVAYVLDLGLIMLAALLLVRVGRRILGVDEASGIGDSIVVPITLTVLYFAVGEGLLGMTLGKWLLGLRVLSARGDAASLGHGFARALVFFAPELVFDVLPHIVALDTFLLELVGSFGGPLATIALFSTARRRNGWRGLHEFASRTRVARMPSPFARLQRESPPPSTELASARDLPARIGNYVVEGAIGATPRGTLVQARDLELERSVWIYVRGEGIRAPDEARRSLVRAGRLRWLDSLRDGDCAYDVFESPGGTSLTACAQMSQGLEWPLAHRCLVTLADELATGTFQHGLCVEQLWIDRSWNLRLLDEPIGGEPFDRRAPIEAISLAARCMLSDAKHERRHPPPDLPAHADETARRILGLDAAFESLAALRAALAEAKKGAITLTRKVRSTQLTLSAALPILFVLILGTDAYYELANVPVKALKCVVDIRLDRAALPSSDQPRLDAEGLRARQILIAKEYAHESSSKSPVRLEPQEQAIVLEARQLHPDPTLAEIAWAKTKIAAEPGDNERGFAKYVLQFTPCVPIVLVSIWGAWASFLALLLRGGLSFSIAGMRIRTSKGKLASRFRCLLRSFAVWLPLATLYLAPAYLAFEKQILAAYIALALTMLAHAGAIAHAILRPTRSLADRVAKTRLVPQ